MRTACIIVNYNDAVTTRKLVSQIRDYKSLDFIVVVDNKSQDDSVLQLSDLVSEKVVLLESSKNGGYGAGNNLGIKYAYENLKSDYVLIANPDVEFEESSLLKLQDALTRNQNAAVSAGVQTNVDGRPWMDVPVWKYVLNMSLFFDEWIHIRSYAKGHFENKKECSVYAVPGSMLLVDVKKMMSVGGYDEDFFLYYEEHVLAEKMKKAGYETIFLPDAGYIHNHHVSIRKAFKRWSPQRLLRCKSCLLFLKKYKQISSFSLLLAELFVQYVKVEMFFYDIYRRFMPLKK